MSRALVAWFGRSRFLILPTEIFIGWKSFHTFPSYCDANDIFTNKSLKVPGADTNNIRPANIFIRHFEIIDFKGSIFKVIVSIVPHNMSKATFRPIPQFGTRSRTVKVTVTTLNFIEPFFQQSFHCFDKSCSR